MPILPIDGRACSYRFDGADDRPVVLFSHSLGCDLGMWDAQAADLLPHFRVLRYDTRGHGSSSRGADPAPEFTIEALARDVLALADACGVERFAFCGLSLGGMIGQWLGANAPQRLTHLVLANTTSRFADPSSMDARRRTVLEGGMRAIADVAMGRFFSPAMLASGAAVVASTRRTLLATDAGGYAGCCAAIRDLNQTALLKTIAVPTLVIAGDYDVPMPWDGNASVLADSIAGARVLRLPAAHLSNLERPRSFSRALLDFVLPAPPDRREAGFKVRRAVLGDDYVDRAIAKTTPFTRDFQALVTDVPWGTIWTRPGLDVHTRRLLVLTTTAALGRWEEFRLHLVTGLAHELEPCDVEEVLLQVAIYAGIPAANAAFHIASEVVENNRDSGLGVPDPGA
ncbi:MAG TPA: 3-oxoadipate enol-lactonase [Vicinamibacterales bacterium]|jgi:3-oxoadipate enol-lactonase/4-carboxymuconolactone decarboxylase